MGFLVDKWNAAKTKFESETGVKKPKEVATLKLGPFAKEYDKQSGLEKGFKEIDELIPASLETVVSEKKTGKLEDAIKDLDGKAQTYIGVLNQEIAAVKKAGGKVDTIYRDIKILRSELEACVARAKLDHGKLVAFREATEQKLSKSSTTTLQMLKTLSQSLDYNINDSIKVAQEMLKAGTADVYNVKIQGAARNVTQPLTNVVKFGIPSEMGEKAQQSYRDAIQDSTVMSEARDLAHRVQLLQTELVKFVKAEGSTPADANLVALASGSVKLPKDASKEDVTAAIKNLLNQIKKARQTAEDVKRALA